MQGINVFGLYQKYELMDLYCTPNHRSSLMDRQENSYLFHFWFYGSLNNISTWSAWNFTYIAWRSIWMWRIWFLPRVDKSNSIHVWMCVCACTYAYMKEHNKLNDVRKGGKKRRSNESQSKRQLTESVHTSIWATCLWPLSEASSAGVNPDLSFTRSSCLEPACTSTVHASTLPLRAAQCRGVQPSHIACKIVLMSCSKCITFITNAVH